VRSILVVVLVKNEESGLTLPPAPEFGPNGEWPRAETEWLPLRWELFEKRTSELPAVIAEMFFELYRQAMPGNAWVKDFCVDPSFVGGSIVCDVSKTGWIRIEGRQGGVREFEVRYVTRNPFYAKELRLLVYSVRWRRKDPVTQLPPGATYEITHTVSTGLSIEHSQTLANSLGLDLGGKASGLQTTLSYKLQQQFGLKLNITQAEETSAKLILSNPSNDSYRAFALWQVDHLLSVKTLRCPEIINLSRGEYTAWRPEWRPCEQVEFAVANQPFITYAEIRRFLTSDLVRPDGCDILQPDAF